MPIYFEVYASSAIMLHMIPLINGVPVECIKQAAVEYSVPAPVIAAVLKAEGGKVGGAVLNKNGTFDYGPMQINSSWLKKLSVYGFTIHDLQYDPCLNVAAGTWILAQAIANDKDVWHGIGSYHSRNQGENLSYQYQVDHQLIKFLASSDR